MRADGYLSADSANFEADIQLHLPDKPPSLAVSEDLWPEQMETHVRLSGKHEATATARLFGFVVAGGRRPVLTLEQPDGPSQVANCLGR